MKHSVLINTLPFAVAALMTLAATGCGRNHVKVYTVDTNDLQTTLSAPPAQGMNGMPATMPDGLPTPDKSGLPSLKYTLPAGWVVKAPSEMRVASFGISKDGRQVDVSVIPLGGMAGGDFANVNRWLGQVGEKPVTEDELPKLAEKVEVAGQSADMYDLAGNNPGSGNAERIIATILHRDDTAWFFKMNGDSDLVEANKLQFVAFLKSVDFGAPGASAAPAAMDMSQLPPSHPPIGGMKMDGAAIPGTEPAAKPQWTVPAGWQAGPLAQFLVAKYIVPGADDAKAEVNVSSLNGDGGGLLANVNRWRGQLGLGPVTDEQLKPQLESIDAGGSKAAVVDISGTNPADGKPAELVGVVLPLGNDTWFYKLMGDAGVVTKQKAAFIQFVQSAKYP
jgi:hypothetical protein